MIKILPEVKRLLKEHPHLRDSDEKLMANMWYKRIPNVQQQSALNVLGNSEILKHYRDINLFIDPVPTDSGQSIGGAYYYYYKNASKPRQTKLNNIFLGPEYDIEKEINYESNR